VKLITIWKRDRKLASTVITARGRVFKALDQRPNLRPKLRIPFVTSVELLIVLCRS
jgi:hypothetical protein